MVSTLPGFDCNQ